MATLQEKIVSRLKSLNELDDVPRFGCPSRQCLVPAYTVQAEVVDISTDTPKAADAFWVDTNVWYWMSYTRPSHRRADRQPKHYQKKLYPAYLKKAMLVRSKFF